MNNFGFQHSDPIKSEKLLPLEDLPIKTIQMPVLAAFTVKVRHSVGWKNFRRNC